MAGNSFGAIFRLTTFGESHGPAIGGIVDGCPAGLEIDLKRIQDELDRRKPGQSPVTSPRKEDDSVEILSGVFENKTTGTPIGFLIRNNDARTGDYDRIAKAYRPSHADFTFEKKFGIRDHRGGGRSSARETACRVVAGAIARQLLERQTIKINAFVRQVGNVVLQKNYSELDLSRTFHSAVRCPEPATAEKMEQLIESARNEGDTVGGVIQCVVTGLPAGLGEPVFDKLHALLGHAMFSINAVKGVEFGSGFAGAARRGSQENDLFVSAGDKAFTQTNNSGGIQGGISNGMPVVFNIAFKPVSTIMQNQETIDTSGQKTVLEAKGRHDPCVLPRAVPVVEAMTAIVLADAVLLARSSRI